MTEARQASIQLAGTHLCSSSSLTADNDNWNGWIAVNVLGTAVGVQANEPNENAKLYLNSSTERRKQRENISGNVCKINFAVDRAITHQAAQQYTKTLGP